MIYDIVIAGAGPAGLAASIYGARAGAEVLVLEKDAIGGRIINSPMVDNYPAAPHISGNEYVLRLLDQVEELGVTIESAQITHIKKEDVFKVYTDMGEYQGRSIIIATGMKHRMLGIPHEDETAGISYCAICDGAFYKHRHACVVGGGNTALTEALFLSNICSSVTLIHRRDAFTAQKALTDQVLKQDNIDILYDTVIEGLIRKDDELTGLSIKNKKDGSVRIHETEGLFVAIGQLPEESLLKGELSTDEAGFYDSGEDCTTCMEGVFVAGDCRRKKVRQLTTAVADGAVAGIAASEYVRGLIHQS